MHDLEDVAGRILKNSAFLQRFLKTRQLPTPSFNIDAPTEFPNPDHERSVEVVREHLIEDTQLLFSLVIGPIDRLKWTLWEVSFAPVSQKSHAKTSISTVHGHGNVASDISL